MSVLVDTSVWIDYFRSGIKTKRLDYLIDENLVVVNDLILAELVPFLKIRKKTSLIELLNIVQKSELSVDWNQIIELRTRCLKNGINKVGIPDLIIVQNAIINNNQVYALDKHFKVIANHTKLRLYDA